MRLAVSLALLVLAACSPPAPPQGYSPDVEINFMRACESRSQTPGLCACVWDKIEAEVPPADFTALEMMSGQQRAAHPLTEQINNYSYACANQLAAEPTAAP